MGGVGSGGYRHGRRHPTHSPGGSWEQITLAEDRPAWERQPRETSKAWEALLVWRSLPLKERSLSETARRLSKSVPTVRRWYVRFRWLERQHAWETHLAREADAAEIDAVRKMRERHIQLATAMQAAGGAVVAKLAKKLQAGERVSIGAAEARALIEAGAKLERQSRGEPDTTARVDVRLEQVDVGALDDERLERLARGEDPAIVLADVPEVH